MDLSKMLDREIFVRTISGLALVLAVLGGIFLGNPYWFVICMCFCFLSLSEFYGMVGKKIHISRIIGYPVAFGIISATAFYDDPGVILPILSAVPFMIFFIEIIRKHLSGVSYGIASSAGTAAGLLYIVLPWSFLVLLRDHIWGMYLVTSLFACTWSCDVAAYIVGSRWGKVLLCPSVSPNKTLEGFAGGFAGSLLCGGALSYIWEISPLPLLLIALICGTLGQVGDLAESLLKREADVKDSGDMIPGHGGFLDRFDSILVNSVLVFIFFGVLW